MIEMIRTLAADITVLEPAAAAAVAQSVEHIVVAGLSSLTRGTPAPEPELGRAANRSRPVPGPGFATRGSPWPRSPPTCTPP